MKTTLATTLSIALVSASLTVMPNPASAVTKDVFCKMTAKHEANKIVVPKHGNPGGSTGKNSNDFIVGDSQSPYAAAQKAEALKKQVYASVYAECMA